MSHPYPQQATEESEEEERKSERKRTEEERREKESEKIESSPILKPKRKRKKRKRNDSQSLSLYVEDHSLDYNYYHFLSPPTLSQTHLSNISSETNKAENNTIIKPYDVNNEWTEERKYENEREEKVCSSRQTISSVDDEWMWGSVRSVQDRIFFEQTFDVESLFERLNENDKKIYQNNPHLRQVYANGNTLTYFLPTTHSPDNYYGFGRNERILSSQSGRTPYRRRTDEYKTVEHWGQRKLLLVEMEFLAQFVPKEPTEVHVVYAGAAPGAHLNLLSSLLPPYVTIHAVDPQPYEAINTPRPRLRNEYFTDALADSFRETLRGHTVLFISDVRSPLHPQMSAEEIDDIVQSDMRAQAHWVERLCPHAALLKFRLPYTTQESPDSASTRYLKGTLYFQVWAGRTSTETRLLLTPPYEYTDYNHKDYESALFHFNTVTRVQYYAHEVTNVEGLDHCYDCMAELYIIRQYIRKLGVPHCVQQYLHTLLRDDKDLSHIEENELIGHFSSFITSQLSPFGKRSLKLM